MKTVYLCGPINGCSDEECTGWREEVKRRLDGRFRFLDPMDRDFRGREDGSAEEIVEGDLRDINDADLVLAMAEKPSWGTAMEVKTAFELGKEVVSVCGSPQPSPWLRMHSTRLIGTLDRAIDYLGFIA